MAIIKPDSLCIKTNQGNTTGDNIGQSLSMDFEKYNTWKKNRQETLNNVASFPPYINPLEKQRFDNGIAILQQLLNEGFCEEFDDDFGFFNRKIGHLVYYKKISNRSEYPNMTDPVYENFLGETGNYFISEWPDVTVSTFYPWGKDPDKVDISEDINQRRRSNLPRGKFDVQEYVNTLQKNHPDRFVGDKNMPAQDSVG